MCGIQVDLDAMNQLLIVYEPNVHFATTGTPWAHT